MDYHNSEKDSIKLNLPNEWCLSQYKCITEKIGSGATPNGGKDSYINNGISLIRSQNVYNNRFDINGIAYIDDNQAEKLRYVSVEKNDVLLNITGDSVARCCIVPDYVLPARVNQHVSIIRTKKDLLNPHFLLYHLVSPYMQEIMLSQAGSGATRNALTKGMIEDFKIPLPPLPEQRAIADILSSLDDKIELNNRMNKTLEEMARAIFNRWFVEFEFPVAFPLPAGEGEPLAVGEGITYKSSGGKMIDSELGMIPEAWEVKKLSDICTLGRGASPRPINDFMNGEVPWIKIADATRASGPFLFETKEKLKSVGVDKSVTVVPGDLILSNSATCGIPIFVELHGCIHDGWLYFKNLTSISNIYLFHVLIELSEHLVHIADGSVQKNLNTNMVGQQYVLVPPKIIKDAFDILANSLFERIKTNSLENITLSSLRDTLLPKLMSGDLRVPPEKVREYENVDAPSHMPPEGDQGGQ